MTQQLYAAKLAESGLTVADGEALGFKYLAPGQGAKYHAELAKRPALLIPYFGSDSKPVKFWRARVLGASHGFDDLTGKGTRYVQAKDSGVRAYFPPNINWPATLADKAVPLTVTEGELKAAAGCAAGSATIGLGGVYSWKSVRLGVDLIPDLKELDWAGRLVYLMFDSDASSNPHVCVALQQFTAELVNLGAEVRICDLPAAADGKKQGLDDYLVHNGPERLQAEVFDQARPAIAGLKLWEFNSQCAYIQEPPVVVIERLNGSARYQLCRPNDFVAHVKSNVFYYEEKVNSQGVSKMVKVPLAQAWLDWPYRRELEKIVYQPGQGRFIDGKYFNSWEGWGVQPAEKVDKKLITWWHQLLDKVFAKADPADREWFERWCAYPLQHPGTKLFTSVLLFGTTQGTGKTQVFECLKDIYGRNGKLIDMRKFDGDFNSWAKNTQFAILDDMTNMERRHQADTVKKVITQSEININEKFIQEYTIRDCINYGMTANHPDTLFLEDTDRRHFVHEVKGPRLEESFARGFAEAMHKSNRLAELSPGLPSLFRYLLDLDLGDFDPTAPARDTPAKRQMRSLSKNEMAAWVAQLLEPELRDQVLSLNGAAPVYDLYSGAQLLAMFDPNARNSQSMCQELRRAGFEMYGGGAGHVVKIGGQATRLFMIKNAERWVEAEPGDIAAHFAVPVKKPRAKNY